MKRIRINIDFNELVKRRERVEKTLAFDFSDRIPVIPYIGARYFLEKIGFGDKISEYINNPKTMLECQLEGQKWILENVDSDFYNLVVYPDFMWVEDVNAFGADISIPQNDSPWVSRPHLLEKDVSLENLRKVDYVHNGFHGKMIEYFQLMQNMAGDYSLEFRDGKIIESTEIVRPGGSGILGLVGIANDLYGTENFSLALYDKPEWAKELLNIISEKSIEWLRAVLDLSGGDMGFCSDRYKNIIHIGDDGTAQLSYDLLKELALESFTKLADFIRSQNCEIQSHNCGKADHLLDFWADDIGIDRYYGFSYLTDKNSIKQKMGGRIKLFGGIDTTLLLEGKPDDVKDYCRKTIDVFKYTPGYVMMDGHNVAPGTPVDNLNAMTEACRIHGSF